ncbi:MAG: DUF3426 domain-containing protein [Caldilineaceae bacterium]|nr:DUF3426 domain-containing protein [Caldilineaceae bacterium]
MLGAQETQTLLPLTEIGQRNPFRIQLTNVAGSVARSELAISWSDVTLQNFERLSVLTQKAETEGGLQITGELRNDHGVPLSDIVVVVTFYDAAGEVLDVSTGSVSPSALSPGESGAYTIVVPNLVDYTSFGVQAQGTSGIR